jgi:hypothetical protein
MQITDFRNFSLSLTESSLQTQNYGSSSYTHKKMMLKAMVYGNSFILQSFTRARTVQIISASLLCRNLNRLSHYIVTTTDYSAHAAKTNNKRLTNTHNLVKLIFSFKQQSCNIMPVTISKE